MNGQEPRRYLLDTGVFIQAYRRYYPPDVCPGYWDALLHYYQQDRIRSIDRVRSEILGGDRLDEWVQQSPDDLFASTQEEAVVQMFARMMRWVVDNNQFQQAAKDEFARVADGWVAAYAKVHNLTVVTTEVHAPTARKNVPLPNVCEEFAVEYYDPFQMLQELGVRFVFDQ